MTLVQLPSFSLSYVSALQILNSPEALSGWSPDAAAAVSVGYAAFRLWMLLAAAGDHQLNSDEGHDEAANEERRVWNEVWPPFERVVLTSISSPDESQTVRDVTSSRQLIHLANTGNSPSAL